MDRSSEKKRRKKKKKDEKKLLASIENSDIEEEELLCRSLQDALQLDDNEVNKSETEMSLVVSNRVAVSKRERAFRCRVFVHSTTLKRLDILPSSYVVLHSNQDDDQATSRTCLCQIFSINTIKQECIELTSSVLQALSINQSSSQTSVRVRPVQPEEVVPCSKLVVLVQGIDRISSDAVARSVNNKHVPMYIRNTMLHCMISSNGVFGLYLNGYFCTITIKECHPSPITLVNQDTIISLYQQDDRNVQSTQDETPPTKQPFSSVGGLERQVQQVKDVLHAALEESSRYPPRGVLLFGPPGTGKTLIARSVADAYAAKMFVINGGELVSSFLGQAESKIKEIFLQAASNQPSIIFIDEIDALCPSRLASANDQMYHRIVALLLQLMDGLHSEQDPKRIVILATTNRPDSLDLALRRPGRFDREIEVSIPNEADRCVILNIHLQNVPHCIESDALDALARRLHGFVGADIMALCREASWNALRRAKASSSEQADIVVTMTDFEDARCIVKPSALRELAIDVPHVKWADIGGQDHIKQQLKETVEWPIKYPENFKRMGIRPPQGVLLYGPPGCSKTLVAKAIATESQMNFIAVKGPELLSKYVGESEKAVRELFRKARLSEPTIIFFDEIDALASSRGGSGSESAGGVADRVLSQMLTEMDGMEERKRVVVVAATNRPDMIDEALMRPGRIDRLIYVPPPDRIARKEILEIQCRKTPLAEDVDLEHLADQTVGFSGAEMVAICKEAALQALEDNLDATFVSQAHFLRAIDDMTPLITQKMLHFYESFAQNVHQRSSSTMVKYNVL